MNTEPQQHGADSPRLSGQDRARLDPTRCPAWIVAPTAFAQVLGTTAPDASGRMVTVVPRAGGPGRSMAVSTKVVKHSRRGVQKIGPPDDFRFVTDLQNMFKVTSQMKLLRISCDDDDEANKMDVVQD